MKWLRYWYYWCLDYWYVTLHQLATLRPGAADQYSQVPAGRQGRGPVIIIPGVYEPWGFLMPLVRAIHGAGHPVYAVEKLGYNLGEIPAAAEDVMDRIRELGLKGVTIVAHSKGGLIGKYAMSFCDPDRLIKKMVAVSTPFSGSPYARFIPFRSVSVFSPQAEIIVKLLREKSANTRIVSVFGEFDPHIPQGSSLDLATNIRLPVVGHFRLLSDPRVVGCVLENL